MKLSTTLILLLTSFNALSQPDVVIGMTIDQVKKIYPDSEVLRYANTVSLKKPESLQGLNGTWDFRFVDGVLDWISWSVYVDEITESNFEEILRAVNKLTKDYARKYGEPDQVSIGDTTFKDPYKKLHYGYDVIETRWNNWRGMRIDIQLS